MMNRRAGAERRKVDEIINRAVQKSRTPGASTFATPSSSTGGKAIISPAIDTGIFTMPDEDGNTIHGFMLDVDTLDSEYTRLF